MATIKDIAQKVGVSSSTVSRVLNYDNDISVNEPPRPPFSVPQKNCTIKKSSSSRKSTM